jgi:hypothetical protein
MQRKPEAVCRAASRTGRAVVAGIAVIAWALGVPGSRPATAQAFQLPPGLTQDPTAVRLEVGELRRLAGVMRSLAGGSVADTAALIQEAYLDHASPGLRAYVTRYNVTAPGMAAAIASRAYPDLDALADSIVARQPDFEAAFRRLQELFPGAVFPTVWFLVGPWGPGGLTRPDGALVAVERYAGRIDELLTLVLHEVAHFQQAVVQGQEVYQRIYGPEGTLLDVALREGSADLIARLTTGAHTVQAAERHGLQHEAELWEQFSKEMHGRETGDWLWVRPRNPDWPPDLGYWIGYRIVARFHEQAEDKQQAMRAILGLTDAAAFLRASGYGSHLRAPSGGGASISTDRTTMEFVRSRAAWWRRIVRNAHGW